MKERKTEMIKQPNPQPYIYVENEISLVDLAKTLVKNKRVFYFIFGIVFFFTLILSVRAFIDKDEFLVSVYKVALEGLPPESPLSLIEVINSFYKDLALTEINDPSYSNFEIKGVNPLGTLYIMLNSEVKEKDFEKIKILHGKILEKLKEGQDQVLAKDLKNLEERLRDSKLELALIRKEKEDMRLIRHEKAPEAIVGFTSQIMALEARIKDMERQKFFFKEGEIIQIAQKKPIRLGTGAAKILGIGIFVGLILGIAGVFIYDFIDKVRKSLSEGDRAVS